MAKSDVRQGLSSAAEEPFPPHIARNFQPVTFLSSLLLILTVFLTLTYFWFEYSDRIDLLLKGDVYTNTAGIYSAPKTLKTGEAITPEDFTAYLKSAGYVEKNQQADASRSRYKIEGNQIEIEPGNTAPVSYTHLTLPTTPYV